MSFETLFIASKGLPIIYEGKELKMIDRIDLSSGKVVLKVSFLSTDSKWRQGIVLQTEGGFEINGQNITTKIILWEDSAPSELELVVNSKDKLLVVYNTWKT